MFTERPETGGCLVFQRVVIPAQELEIGEFRLPAVEPADDVIDVAPTGGPEALWVLAMTITGDHGSSESWRDYPGLATDIEWFRPSPKYDP